MKKPASKGKKKPAPKPAKEPEKKAPAKPAPKPAPVEKPAPEPETVVETTPPVVDLRQGASAEIVKAAREAFEMGNTVYNVMGGIYEMDREYGDRLKAAVAAWEKN